MKRLYSDEEIIGGIRSGDNLIIEYLYLKYREKVINYVVYNSGNRNDAEDVFQDSFVKFFQMVKKKEFTLKKTVEVYFSTIYMNTWRYAIKLKNRQSLTEMFQEELNDAELIQFDEYKNDQLQKLVWKQYKQLREDCQTVLDMYYFQKKTMNEIAYEMNYKNEQIAKNKKYRCLESLKTLIKSQLTYKLLIYE